MIEQETEVIFNRKVADGTFLMGLRSYEIASGARPGQFVMVRVRQGFDPLLRRPFSICETHEKDILLILYRLVGRGTTILSHVREGTKLPVTGPLGRGFDIPEPGRKSLLIAGGIGIAPLIFLARKIKMIDLIFMAGYGSVKEIIDLESAGLKVPDIRIATDDGTLGHKGLVTDLLESYMTMSGNEMFKVFSCGPLPMLKRIAAMAINSGAECQVSLEASMACGLGACQGCAVKASPDQVRVYYLVCRDGPVFPAKSIDWKGI